MNFDNIHYDQYLRTVMDHEQKIESLIISFLEFLCPGLHCDIILYNCVQFQNQVTIRLKNNENIS